LKDTKIGLDFWDCIVYLGVVCFVRRLALCAGFAKYLLGVNMKVHNIIKLTENFDFDIISARFTSHHLQVKSNIRTAIDGDKKAFTGCDLKHIAPYTYELTGCRIDVETTFGYFSN
jgi:hypothetical protein